MEWEMSFIVAGAVVSRYGAELEKREPKHRKTRNIEERKPLCCHSQYDIIYYSVLSFISPAPLTL